MAYRTEHSIGGDEDREETTDLPLPRLNPFPDYPKRYGPLEVTRDWDALALRRENAGGLGWEAYLFFGIAMVAVTILGMLSVVQSDEHIRLNGYNDTTNLFAPSQNQFGTLWIWGIVSLLVGVPLYVVRAYRAAHVFTFDKANGAFYENKRRIASLQRIEYVGIRETKDPDGRFLYLLRVFHTDGNQVLLHNGYDEREIMNLANEIAGFLDCRTKYTGVKA